MSSRFDVTVEFNKLKEFSKGKVEEAQGFIRTLRSEKEELEKKLEEAEKKAERERVEAEGKVYVDPLVGVCERDNL